MIRRSVIWTLVVAAAIAVVVLAPDDRSVVAPTREALRAGPNESEGPRVDATRVATTEAGLAILAIRPRELDISGANPFPVRQAPARPKSVVRAAPVPVEPSAPQAPPIPFQVVGRFVDDNREAVFLMHADQTLVARVGDTLVGSYQVESLSAVALTLLYIPLQVRQVLPLAPAP